MLKFHTSSILLTDPCNQVNIFDLDLFNKIYSICASPKLLPKMQLIHNFQDHTKTPIPNYLFDHLIKISNQNIIESRILLFLMYLHRQADKNLLITDVNQLVDKTNWKYFEVLSHLAELEELMFIKITGSKLLKIEIREFIFN
jgi:hypothetical protein